MDNQKQKLSEQAVAEANLHFNPMYSKDEHTACVSCYIAGANLESKRFMDIIENYKRICGIAGVPKLLIDNPNLIVGQLPTDEQIRESWETIRQWEIQAQKIDK